MENPLIFLGTKEKSLKRPETKVLLGVDHVRTFYEMAGPDVAGGCRINPRSYRGSYDPASQSAASANPPDDVRKFQAGISNLRYRQPRVGELFSTGVWPDQQRDLGHRFRLDRHIHHA